MRKNKWKALCVIAVALFLVMLFAAAVAPLVSANAESGVVVADVPAATASTDDSGAPFTWAYLLTIGGATAATLLIVQFLKVPLDKVWKLPTRVFTYVVALAIMIGAAAFTGGLSTATIPLLALNAFIVATSAYGAYEITFARRKEVLNEPPAV